jgi:hypothetical protein
MRFTSVLRTILATICLFSTTLCLTAQKQVAQGEDSQAKAPQGIPARATAGDYEARAQAGTLTIAAEFLGHSVATPETLFTTEDYLVIETGLFGSPGARITLSPDDFSLRVNGKKAPLPSQPYALVFKSLKDPAWEDSQAPAAGPKSKGGLTGGGQGGGGQGDSGPAPAPVHMPIQRQRAMEQRVEKASFPAGNRALPQAGLIFFQYGGSLKGIRSIELMYAGEAGKATVTLHP